MRSEPVCHPLYDNCFRVVGIQPLGSKENNTSPQVDDYKDDESDQTTGTQPMEKDEESDLTTRMAKFTLGSPASHLLATSPTDPLLRTPPVYQQLDLSAGSPCWSPSALSTSSLDSSRVGFTPPVSLFTLCISPIITFLKLIVPGSCTARDGGRTPPPETSLCPRLRRPSSRG